MVHWCQEFQVQALNILNTFSFQLKKQWKGSDILLNIKQLMKRNPDAEVYEVE